MKPFLNPTPAKLTTWETRARQLARAEIAELYPRLKHMTIEDLLALDPIKLTVVEGIFVQKLQNDYRKGDTAEIHRMYDRLLGSIHKSISVDVDIQNTTFTIDILNNDNIESQMAQGEIFDAEVIDES